MDFEEEKQQLADYLEANDMRHSKRRDRVLEEFLASERHLTAEELYDLASKKYPDLGQATVYRALKLFCEAGICRKLELGEGPTRYEPRSGHEHHDHLFCTSCGQFEEVVDPLIEQHQERLAEEKGYRLENHRLVLYGLCPDCKH